MSTYTNVQEAHGENSDVKAPGVKIKMLRLISLRKNAKIIEINCLFALPGNHFLVL